MMACNSTILETWPAKCSRLPPRKTVSGRTGAIVVSPRSIELRNSPERPRSLACSTVLPSMAPPGSTIISMANRRLASSNSATAERRPGRTAGAIRMITATPTRAIGRPSLPISKKPIGSRPNAGICPDTTRLVDVPITVINPPRTAANDTGMSTLEADTPRRSAHDRTCGISMATMGVLLRNADAPAVGTNVRSNGSR